MNIEDLLQSLPSRDDVANAVGLHGNRNSYASTATDLLPALGIFGTGMLLGAGLALLFAPKAGSEIRQDIADKMQEFGSTAREYADEASEQGRQYAEQGRQLASEVAEKGRQMASQAGDQARQMASDATGEYGSTGTTRTPGGSGGRNA